MYRHRQLSSLLAAVGLPAGRPRRVVGRWPTACGRAGRLAELQIRV